MERYQVVAWGCAGDYPAHAAAHHPLRPLHGAQGYPTWHEDAVGAGRPSSTHVHDHRAHRPAGHGSICAQVHDPILRVKILDISPSTLSTRPAEVEKGR